MQNKQSLLSTKNIMIMGMIAGIAFLMAATLRFPVIPAVGFLRFDPKDIVIVIGGFILGPLASLIIAVVVSLVQMFTTSSTGLIGFFMNVVSSVAFACTAAYIYSKKRTLSGAVIGLAAGIVIMTVAMVLWNYILTPIFMGWPRPAVVAILWTGIVPFNLFSGVLNSAIILLIYKPITAGLVAANLIPAKSKQAGTRKIFNPALIAITSFVILTAVVLLAIWQGWFADDQGYYNGDADNGAYHQTYEHYEENND